MKRERWVIAAMLCIIAALVTVLLRKPEVVRAVSAEQARPATRETLDSSPKTHAPAAPALPDAQPQTRGGEEIEVCGAGFIPIEEAARTLPVFPRPTPELSARFSATLASSTSQSARALGLLLDGSDAADRASAPLQARLELCGEDKHCLSALWDEAGAVRLGAARDSVDALARMAATSLDPAVYAMAIQACGAYDPSGLQQGNCQLINLQRWAQLDPDNVVPWTHLASEGMRRNEPEAASEALFRAGIANASRVYGDSLLAIAEPALSSGLSLNERRQIAGRILAAQGSWGLPGYRTPLNMCSEEALRDSNRRQICDAYAQSLVDKGNTAIERAIGTRLGERLHWPAERIDVLRKEREAMALAQEDATGNPLSCAAQERAIDRAMRNARLGEIGSGRAALAASGKSIDDWVRIARERREGAASASAPGSAASGA